MNTAQEKERKLKRQDAGGKKCLRVTTPKLFLGLFFPVWRGAAETMRLAL